MGFKFYDLCFSRVGDKSQLAAIGPGGSSGAPRAVFLGSVAALIVASFLGVLVGGGMAQILPAKLLKAIAATIFIVMALRLLWSGRSLD
ncbi:MAG: TMEM165/GDT1 family protein [Chloroflexaceae bacterium]|nr:TMEM165/GDT1 family protein [Chloroflexaceae bacterium]